MADTEHLGDGCYVQYNKLGDGGITFMANSHNYPTDTVHLEPNVVNAFFNWFERLKKENNAD